MLLHSSTICHSMCARAKLHQVTWYSIGLFYLRSSSHCESWQWLYTWILDWWTLERPAVRYLTNWVPGTQALHGSCAAYGFDEAVVLSNEFRTQNFLVNLKVIDVAILKVSASEISFPSFSRVPRSDRSRCGNSFLCLEGQLPHVSWLYPSRCWLV